MTFISSLSIVPRSGVLFLIREYHHILMSNCKFLNGEGSWKRSNSFDSSSAILGTIVTLSQASYCFKKHVIMMSTS